MRHGKTINHLGRTAPHRKAMLSNLASSLILHKRITTTVAKAKELRKFVEPLLTKSKDDNTHSRRTVFAYLKNKEVVKELYGSVADKIAARPGGYTRILKLGNRQGDNADMCIIELVDFNETMLAAAAPAKTRTRRSRRGAGAAAGATAAAGAATATEVVMDEPTATVEDRNDEQTEVKAAAADEAPEAGNEGEAPAADGAEQPAAE